MLVLLTRLKPYLRIRSFQRRMQPRGIQGVKDFFQKKMPTIIRDYKACKVMRAFLLLCLPFFSVNKGLWCVLYHEIVIFVIFLLYIFYLFYRKMHKMRLGTGLCPDPLGELTTLSQTSYLYYREE